MKQRPRRGRRTTRSKSFAWNPARISDAGRKLLLPVRKPAPRRSQREADRMLLAELGAQLVIARASVAALEGLERTLQHDLAARQGQCEIAEGRATCRGTVWSRFCRTCGAFVSRCEAHGGIDAASCAMRLHFRQHGGEVGSRLGGHRAELKRNRIERKRRDKAPEETSNQ